MIWWFESCTGVSGVSKGMVPPKATDGPTLLFGVLRPTSLSGVTRGCSAQSSAKGVQVGQFASI